MNGYISNLRLVKGTAVYTANFTPPTTPLTAISGTSLLLSGTNAGIIDTSTKFNPVTYGDAKISTAVVKYHTGSMIFDGTGDYLTVPPSSILQFGASPFTVEFWMYPTNVAGDRGIFGLHGVGTDHYCGILINNAGNLKTWYRQTSLNNVTGSTTLVANTWYHVALVRTSDTVENNLRIYLNGVQDGGRLMAGTENTFSIPTTSAVVGRTYYDNNQQYFIGYLDDLRVTKGVARYTSTFTPPTAPFAAF